MFSDDFHVSRNDVSSDIYPSHVTLLNFTGDRRRRPIMNIKTVCAYFPAQFDLTSREKVEGTSQEGKPKPGSSKEDAPIVALLHTLHESIRFCLQEAADQTLKGVECRTTVCRIICLLLLPHCISRTYQIAKVCIRLGEGYVHYLLFIAALSKWSILVVSKS